MPSSVIHQFRYEPERRELNVTFTTGRRYVYRDVPPSVADDFKAAFSKGAFFNACIRDHFAYLEVEPATR